MIQVVYQIAEPGTGRQGHLRIAGGIWVGEQCVFEFSESLYGLTGTACCDWRQPEATLTVHEGDPERPEAEALLTKIRTLLLPFHRSAFRNVTKEQLTAFYGGDYHRTMNYAVDSAGERAFKRLVVDQVLTLGAPGKLLDAGCSAGEVVRQLRERGIDAHGFDLCSDLDRIAYPEAAPFVRQGSATAIPYGPEDGFDTLLALDVFEHIPEHQVATMVGEFARLGVQRVIAHIALCEFEYPGHLTLRPLSWWDRQMEPWFVRTDPANRPAMVGACGGDPSRYLRVYELAMANVR